MSFTPIQDSDAPSITQVGTKTKKKEKTTRFKATYSAAENHFFPCKYFFLIVLHIACNAKSLSNKVPVPEYPRDFLHSQQNSQLVRIKVMKEFLGLYELLSLTCHLVAAVDEKDKLVGSPDYIFMRLDRVFNSRAASQILHA
jgi:hypothetical protein